jgi:hypothetical protein
MKSACVTNVWRKGMSRFKQTIIDKKRQNKNEKLLEDKVFNLVNDGLMLLAA